MFQGVVQNNIRIDVFQWHFWKQNMLPWLLTWDIKLIISYTLTKTGHVVTSIEIKLEVK